MNQPPGTPPSFVYRLLIVDSDNPAEKLLFDAQHPRQPPHFHTRERHFWQTVDPINRAANMRFGLDTTVLRFLTSQHHEGNNMISRVYALELAERGKRLQPSLRWGDASALKLETDRRAWQLWRDWLASPGSQAVPWYRPGWSRAICKQIMAALRKIEYSPTGSIEQLRSWERSTILRIPTDRDVLYFKQVPAMFAAELRLYDVLRQQFPNRFPRPLLIDYDQHWSVMPDLGNDSLHQVSSQERWQIALHQFGRLQRDMTEHLPQFRRAGIPARPPAQLPAGLMELLAGGRQSISADHVQLNEAQFARLQGLVPQIADDVARLANFDIPLSIEHGDFWGSQILPAGDRFHFIDWSDSSISHPFFSMTFLAEAEGLPPGLNEARSLLGDAYLSAWEGLFSPADLRQAFHIALRLGPLHHALIYQRTILPQMAVKKEMHNMVPFYLLNLLSGYEEQKAKGFV